MKRRAVASFPHEPGLVSETTSIDFSPVASSCPRDRDPSRRRDPGFQFLGSRAARSFRDFSPVASSSARDRDPSRRPDPGFQFLGSRAARTFRDFSPIVSSCPRGRDQSRRRDPGFQLSGGKKTKKTDAREKQKAESKKQRAKTANTWALSVGC